MHILIYTWNKAEEVGRTLESLRKTAYPNYKLFLLDNGSTDTTRKTLDVLPEKWFPELECIHLPVNTGAPAARNWLLKAQAGAPAEYIAFLDDDVLVSPGWLDDLVQTLEEHPDAGVVGAKIINARGPKVIQHSGGVLTSPDDWINRVALFGNIEDRGQFDTVGERDYVMGCANLYRRDVFDVVGDFDLRFSPTQFDDVDHHLRLRLAGYKVLFNGLVEVRHMRNSGGQASANHVANRFKLEQKYCAADAARIIRNGALKDFVAKHPWVAERN